jgi:hypothetical protein
MFDLVRKFQKLQEEGGGGGGSDPVTIDDPLNVFNDFSRGPE